MSAHEPFHIDYTPRCLDLSTKDEEAVSEDEIGGSHPLPALTGNRLIGSLLTLLSTLNRIIFFRASKPRKVPSHPKQGTP